MDVVVQAQPVDEKSKEKKEYGKYDKWEIESAARTLEEAETIKQDKEKMKYVAMCMKEKFKGMQKAIESIDDIKAVRNSKNNEEYNKEAED